jgi:hypothetical protein
VAYVRCFTLACQDNAEAEPLIEPLLPFGRPRTTLLRSVVNALFFMAFRAVA